MRVLTVTNADGTDARACAHGGDAVARALAAWRVTMRDHGGSLVAVRGGALYHAVRADGSVTAVLTVREHP